jgi:hypothetical protein
MRKLLVIALVLVMSLFPMSGAFAARHKTHATGRHHGQTHRSPASKAKKKKKAKKKAKSSRHASNTRHSSKREPASKSKKHGKKGKKKKRHPELD